jgi:hypothetical protein
MSKHEITLQEMAIHSAFGKTIMVIMEVEKDDESKLRNIKILLETHKNKLSELGKRND